MSHVNPAKEAADAEKVQGDAAHKKSDFDAAIRYYQNAWEFYADPWYKINEATNRYQKGDYLGAVAALQNGLDNGEPGTLHPAASSEVYLWLRRCHVALGDVVKGAEFSEKWLAGPSNPPLQRRLAKSKTKTDRDRELGDKIATTVLSSFAKLPKKRKPLEGGGKKEWVPLAGVVAQVGDNYTCIALGTGMKCLPHNKLASAEGKVLHDWHAEVVALRSLNAFFLEEINKLRGEGRFLKSPQKSDYLRPVTWDERKSTVGRWHRDRPDYRYTVKEGIKLHMYCSEAPCGDASMELTMAAQEDATPWDAPTDADAALPGRGGFGQLGIVRRKPSRPDAPECRSKSCSDKLAQKQMTSVLNSLTSLAISPSNAYLATFTIPESQHVHDAFQRCFGEKGRLRDIKERPSSKGGYAFRPFKTLTTSKEFDYSRRSLGPDGSAPKPSNIACSWSPHHHETIIGGILQGCKMTTPPRDEAASVLSRYKMWQALEADKHTSDSETQNSSFARSYKHAKSKKRLHARNMAKLAVRTVMMAGKEWVANTGDDEWARGSEQSLAKKTTKALDHDPTSDDSDAVSDHGADLAMARERYGEEPELTRPARAPAPAPHQHQPSGNNFVRYSEDELLEIRTHWDKKTAAYPSVIEQSRLDEDGELEYKVRYVQRFGRQGNPVWSCKFILWKDIRQRGAAAYEKSIEDFHLRNPGEPGLAESAVEKVKVLKKRKEEEREEERMKKEDEERYAAGLPKLDRTKWHLFPQQTKELRRAERKLRSEPPGVARDKEEAELGKAIEDKIAEAVAMWRRTRGRDTWYETQWRVETMLEEVLEESGRFDQKAIEKKIECLYEEVSMENAREKD